MSQKPIIYKRPALAKYQLDAIFCSERYAIIEATTKAGKTVGCLAWILEKTITEGKAGREYWWAAPVIEQAKIAFRRAKNGLPRTIFSANETERSITFINGARLVFKSAEKPDNLYGEDVYAAVLDEASRVREESFHALRSTLTATRAPLRLIGNVKGRKNFFYKLARKAEAGEKGMHYAKITAWDAVKAGVLAKAEVEDARRLLPDAVFKELYLAIPTEDGSNPFGFKEIKSCIIPEISTRPPVAFGVDLAKSVDFTVIIGLDEQGRVAYFDRFQKSWKHTTADIIKAVGEEFCLVDSTGVGDPITETLQDGRSNFEGFKFSSVSKQQLMESLRLFIHRAEVFYPDGVIRNELDSFEYEYTRTGVRYNAPEGFFDDCVCSLALARLALKNKGDHTWTEEEFRLI